MSTSTEENPVKEKRTFDFIKTWFLNSPTHGIRRISRANSITGRLFWSFIFLVFATLMSVFICTVIMKHIAYPTKISLSVRQYRNPDHIPTVTFCKFDSLRKDKNLLFDLSGNLNPLRNESFLDENSACARSSCTDKQRYKSFIEYMKKFLVMNINNTHSTTIPSGYQLDELLIQCTFNNRPCHHHFTPFFYPNYGNCYTFNLTAANDNIGRKNISRATSIEDEYFGDSYKLSLELFVYENEYIPFIEERTAFRIYIHRPNEIPILSPNSLFLAPKTFTKLIYSQRILTFSQQCRRELTEEMNMMFNGYSMRYSQALCLKLCEFRFIEQVCRCSDPLLLVFVRFFARNRTIPIDIDRICPFNRNCNKARVNFGQYSQKNKKKSISMSFVDSKISCPECLPECELIQYTIQSSYADYPNTRSMEQVYQRVEKHISKVKHDVHANTSACVNNRKEVLLDNIVAVEISASPYATEVLAESPMYTWVDLISSIGGQTGQLNIEEEIKKIEFCFSRIMDRG